MATEETKIELIGKDISYILKDIAEIKQSVNGLSGVYATQVSVDTKLTAVEERLKKLETSSNLWRWLNPLITAVGTSIVTILVLSFLDKLR